VGNGVPFMRASARVGVNGELLDSIQLQCSLWQGCPLAPNFYVIAANALGYLLETARLQGQIRGISLPGGNQLLNVHFVDDSPLTPKLTQQSVEGTLLYLDTLAKAVSGFLMRKLVFLVGQDDPPVWLNHKWKLTRVIIQ
jgi:hypothetical protein